MGPCREYSLSIVLPLRPVEKFSGRLFLTGTLTLHATLIRASHTTATTFHKLHTINQPSHPMTAMTSKMTSTSAANALITFINASPTAWHAVHNASALLEKAGFRRVEEGSNWEKDLEGGSKIFYTRCEHISIATLWLLRLSNDFCHL